MGWYNGKDGCGHRKMGNKGEGTMSECTHDCSSCGANCPSRDQQQSLLEKPHAGTNIKKVIAVMSGKGGVGKSMVTALLAVLAQRAGFKTAILDADITGPPSPRPSASSRTPWATKKASCPWKAKRASS